MWWPPCIYHRWLIWSLTSRPHVIYYKEGQVQVRIRLTQDKQCYGIQNKIFKYGLLITYHNLNKQMMWIYFPH